MEITDEIIEAAAKAAFRRDYAPMGSHWLDEHSPEQYHRDVARRALATALPLIEAAVREMVAGEIEAMSVQTGAGNWDYAPNVRAIAARIARGGR